MFDRVVIVLALAMAAIVIGGTLLVPGDTGIPELVNDPIGLMFFGVWTIGALPIAFAMPRLRAAFFGQLHVPSRAYLLPRWLLRLDLGLICGLVLGYFTLAVLRDHRLFWLVGSMAAIAAAFWAGARPRLRKPYEPEWAVPYWRLPRR